MKIMLGRNIINILIFSFVLVVLFFQSAYISSLKGIYLVLVTFVVILPFLIFFKKKLPLLVISLFFSSLIIPGLTNRFNLFYIILITFLIFDFLRKPTFTSNDKKIEFILVSFVILLVLTITVRGIGIQFLGSKNIGGFAYIQILATILLILKFRTIHLSEKDWYKAIYVMCILGILPLVISLLVGTHIITINNPVVWFFQISGDTLAYLTESANISDVRINPAKSASIFILILILLKNSNIGKLDKQFYIGFLFSILIAGLSGFRSSTIILIGFTLIYFFLNNRYKYRFFYLSASALIFLILTMFLQDLPYTIQRAFAWIPFLDVSDQARKSAFGTNEWRIAVWKYALKEIPYYWLVGKGLTFNINNSLLFSIPDQYFWAIQTLNYHNGPLSVLITLGAGGLVLTLVFLFYTVKRHLRFKKYTWNSDILKRLHLIILSYLLIQIVFFIFVFGETTISLPKFFFLAALLEGLVNSDKKIFKSNKMKKISGLVTNL